MGVLSRLPVAELAKAHAVLVYVETGLENGDGFMHAVEVLDVHHYHGVDLDPAALYRVEERLTVAKVSPFRWTLWLGDSASVVRNQLLGQKPILAMRALWWLDAHLPQLYGLASGTETPLLAEVRAIVEAERDHSQDVILADDMRLYGGRHWGSGPLPQAFTPAPRAELEEVLRLLEPTHDVTIRPQDEGYLIALPR